MSKLLHIDAALILAKKIVNYLLSETHEAGWDKQIFSNGLGSPLKPGRSSLKRSYSMPRSTK